MSSDTKVSEARLAELSGHTPGPWKVRKSIHGNEYRHVQIGKDETYTTLDVLPADARLIAAAPDLLRELQAARALIAEAGAEELMFFYNVGTLLELVAAQAKHIDSLLASRPPLRDENPRTPREG
jgi:hypothetical protein